MARHSARVAHSIATVLVLLTVAWLPGGVALAAPGFNTTIPVDTVVFSPPGRITQVASIEVPEEFEGQQCEVRSVALNQQSIHPDNNLLVSSGSSTVVLPDVESGADKVVIADSPLTLGSSITVSVQMGPDRRFSGGFDVIIECDPHPSGWACVDGTVTFIEDATDFEGTLYETAEEAANDPNCMEVEASTTFTISGSCAVVEGAGVFTISGNLGEGVTLQVAGQTLDSVGAFSIDVGAPGAYAYEVTLDDGFVLAEGSPAPEGTIAVADCVPPPPPSGWACIGGEVQFIEDATDFEGTLYETEAEAEADPSCQEEVLAAITVTVGGVCSTDDGEVGVITVNVSVDGGATVVVRDSDGDIVGTFTEDGSVEVPEDSAYTWAATPNEGFEFPVGSATTGSVTIPDCIDELPFTGVEADVLALIAGLVAATGGAILLATRKPEES